MDGSRPGVSRSSRVARHLVIYSGELGQERLQVSLQVFYAGLGSSEQRLLVRVGVAGPGVVGAEFAEAHQLHVDLILQGPSLFP